MVCNSIPVDIRTTQLVPGTGLRYGDGPRDGNAVFKVAVQTQVSAGSYQLLVGNRDIHAVTNTCPAGVCHHRKPVVGGNERAITVPEGDGLGAGQVGDGRDRADIETAQIVFPTEVGALKWGRYDPAKP